MLVIISTHPIQYQVPIWKHLAKRENIKFEVWYLTSHGIEPTYDIQFGKTIMWDIDLLDGYPYCFSKVHCPKKSNRVFLLVQTLDNNLPVHNH